MQPNLFYQPETKPFDEQARMKAGKCVINRLLTVRQQLEAANCGAFTHLLNDAINAVRSEISCPPAQRENLILSSIEKSQANTFEEIADDTRLSVDIVKRIVYRLESENVLGIIPRSKRSKTELIYSRRKINRK
jgi:predicted transcriptional regulator